MKIPTPRSDTLSPFENRCGFTLLELLVSISVLMIVLLVLMGIVNSTQKIWKQTAQRIDAFRAARTGFESMTRRLSQATLNTYWDYNSTNAPTRYIRSSELRFLSGTPATGGTTPTHSVFFQAPLGYTSNSTRYFGLDNLINTLGYYITVSSDKAFRPTFLSIPEHTRFRLMQLLEPSENLTIYSQTSGGKANQYQGNEWFTTPLATPGYSHVIADNVIALVLLPKISTQQDPTGGKLTSNYTFSSAPTGYPYLSANQTSNENQLPPLVQVTMVTIDEASAARLEQISNGDPATMVSKLGLGTLFQQVGSLTDNSQPGYAQDLKTLTDKLQSLHLNYRVFNTDVSIRGAKWSQ